MKTMTLIETKYTETELKVLRIFLESFFLGILKPLRSKHVIEYAETNKIVDPRTYIYTLPLHIKIKIREILKNNPNIIKQHANYDIIINILRQYRPDLYKTLSNPKYRAWFTKFILILQKIIEKI